MAQTEKKATETDSSRRTIFMVVAIGSALLVAGLVYLATRPAARPAGEARLEGALRTDSAEFAPLRERLLVDFNADQDASQSDRPLGDVVITMNPVVRNFTGRTISGLELHATARDINGKVIKERYSIPIPTRQPELATNKTLRVPITIEGIQKDNVPASLKVELSGVKFK
ncbi:MAG TPA: hypothetical protein VNA19_04115 [Pyrinomonadaceae bacterium]|jgi:hypothetical protein|nr:hypothetical protein [Pyrinomonadaceae bacterium]